jgi:DNA-binding response OmpR family regulator
MAKVLVIDDNESFEKYVVPYLAAKGFDVFIEKNGKKGIESFRENVPDIVVLDLGLPDMDGAEVYAKLKEIGPDVPIGILSGYGEREKELLSMGAEVFFEKPVMASELEKWINEVVGKH